MFRYLFTYIIRGMPILATDLLRHPTSKFLRQILSKIPCQAPKSLPCSPTLND